MNIEFHTIIISFVMTVLVSGCVFMYCRSRVLRVEEMMIEQNRVIKNYITHVDTIRHERVLESMKMTVGGVNDAREQQDINVIANSDTRMDVSDDENIQLEIAEDGFETGSDTDDENASMFNGSSDSEEVDDTSASGDEADEISGSGTNDPVQIETEQINVSSLMAEPPSQSDIPIVVDVSMSYQDDQSASMGSNSSRMTKKDLCERITYLNISKRSISTLMKLKRDELASMLEESGLD